MNLRCFFNHKPAGRLPSRCVRCDVPMGRILTPPRVSDSEAVLLGALGEIKALGVSNHSTHHEHCRHAPCIAERAIEEYWRIVLAPFEGRPGSP